MSAPIDQPLRPLGDAEVPAVGLGCMGMSDFYGDTPRARSLATLRHALEVGVTHWDTSDIYGPHTNERLLGEVLADAGARDRVFLATKFGIVRDDEGNFVGLNGCPGYARTACEGSLRRLGVDHIDLYYQHRPDPEVPVEETIAALARLVDDGKIRAIGLSECSADTLRRAHAVHPVAAYQGEYSLWTRVHEGPGDVLETCAELGITYVAYSPLGRGFLTGAITSPDDLDPDDWRRSNPRFSPENFQQNLDLVDTVRDIAAAHDASPAQVALAWVLSRGDHIVTIPGTTRAHRVEENARAALLSLSDHDLARLSKLPEGAGARYG